MSRRTPTERAVTLVMRWCDLYSRGVPESAAEVRREELLCDLTDQVEWAAAHDALPEHTARSIYGRAVRGAPADLSWRLHQRSWSEVGSPVFRRFGVGLLSVTVASGFVLAFVAVLAIARTMQGESLASALGQRSQLLVLIAAIAVLLGEQLLIRVRTRSLGALWMLAAAQVVVFVGLPMLASTGRILSPASLSPAWATCLGLAGLGVAIFYLTGALWWLTITPKGGLGS